MFLKLIALAAVGGAAWLFMRPQIPILPPGIIGKKRKSIATESAPKAKAKKTGSAKEMEVPQVNMGCFIHPENMWCFADAHILKNIASRMSAPACFRGIKPRSVTNFVAHTQLLSIR